MIPSICSVDFTSVTPYAVDGGNAFASFRLADAFDQTVVDSTISLNGNSTGYFDNGTGNPAAGPSLQFLINDDFMLATNQVYSVSLRTRLQAS